MAGGLEGLFIAPLSRYLSLRAEARLKQGNNAGCLADVNVVRNRAAKAGTGYCDATPGPLTLDQILDERAKELDGDRTDGLTS